MPNNRQQIILDTHCLHVVRTLQKNQRKGLSVFLVADDAEGRSMVMKFCDASNPQSVHDFSHEKQFYSDNSVEFAPQMVYAGDDYLCIEYIEGSSLLKYLQQRNPGPEEAELLAGELVRMAMFFAPERRDEPGDPVHFIEHYERYLAKLFNSGPKGSGRPEVEEFLLRQCWRVLRPLLMRRSSTLLNQTSLVPHQGMAHNDFHQNNILIDDHSKLYLIDFENYGPGYWTIDLIYGLSTLYATGRIERTAIFNAIAGPCGSYPVLKPLLAIALCVVGTNRKFRNGTLADVIINLARLVGYGATGSVRILMGRL